MRILASKTFDRFVRKQKIKDSDLVGVVTDANKGLIEADLGGGVFKLHQVRANPGVIEPCWQ